jgi:capsular exopolysaccharide synthesis family protein
MGDPALVFSRAPLSKAAEAYRYLRSRVKPLITSVADGGTVLLVTSAQAREGRTAIAANLATALAHAGSDVIVVDADLRRPSLSEVFGADARPGLTDLLVGKAALKDVAVPTDIPGLRLVAVGDEGYQAADRFEVTRLTRAFAEMNAAADVVIVDSAPVLAVSDAITLARVSDLVMMVADVRSTGRAAVRAAVQEVRATGPRTIIGVLNNERSPGSGRARSSVAREPESLTHPPRAPTRLADVVPPSGPNGQLEALLGTNSTRPHRPVDEADADGSGGSGRDSA